MPPLALQHRVVELQRETSKLKATHDSKVARLERKRKADAQRRLKIEAQLKDATSELQEANRQQATSSDRSESRDADLSWYIREVQHLNGIIEKQRATFLAELDACYSTRAVYSYQQPRDHGGLLTSLS